MWRLLTEHHFVHELNKSKKNKVRRRRRKHEVKKEMPKQSKIKNETKNSFEFSSSLIGCVIVSILIFGDFVV